MSYCLTAFGKGNGRGKTSHTAINKTEGSEFTTGKHSSPMKEIFISVEGKCTTALVLSSSFQQAAMLKNLSGNPGCALCTLGAFLIKMVMKMAHNLPV